MANMFKSKTFGSVWTELAGHPSGFDYMRICLAVAVLLWHSYQTSYGTQAALNFWSAGNGYYLDIILPMFFCLSGFLVAGSLERTPSLRKFLTLRAIRIYPALCVEVVVSALFLGPIVTSDTLRQYFTDRHFFSYFMNTIGWIHYTLPGVFVGQPLDETVNTSLWTVPFELECYIALAVLVLLGFMKNKIMTAVMFAIVTLLVIINLHMTGESGRPAGGINGRVLLLCFLAGTVIFRLRALIPYNGLFALGCTALAVPMLQNECAVFMAPLLVAYATSYLRTQNPSRNFIVNSGDYSYGVYLYAAPIQQTVVWVLGDKNTYLTNASIALPCAVLFSLFSWHAIEKPFMKVKRYVLTPKS